MFHCGSNTGYAINRLEHVFFQLALAITDNDVNRIHFSYTDLDNGRSDALPKDFENITVIQPRTSEKDHLEKVEAYLVKNDIDIILGFDIPVSLPIYKIFRKVRVSRLISYWGAPIGSLISPFKLILKYIQVYLVKDKPDLFIFESEGMQKTATHGRGIPKKNTAVVYLGVDTEMFKPHVDDNDHVYRLFDIERDKKIFIYSGHMEHRKGPQVILRAANILRKTRPENDWHILLLGNTPEDRERLLKTVDCKNIKENITFGGYVENIEKIHRGCYAGIIASCGWDSLTCSSLEMQSSGLPLLLSDLPGLNEAIEDKHTGYLFEPDNETQLAENMSFLLSHPEKTKEMGQKARKRIEERFGIKNQVDSLIKLVKS